MRGVRANLDAAGGGTYLIFPLVKLILGPPPPFLIIIAQSLSHTFTVVMFKETVRRARSPSTPDGPLDMYIRRTGTISVFFLSKEITESLGVTNYTFL